MPRQQQMLFHGMNELRSDYNAARSSRFRRTRGGIPYQGADADWHLTQTAMLRMMETFRDFDRNDPIFGQGVTRLIDNVCPGKINLDPNTGDTQVDQHLTKLWDDWASNPNNVDSAREHDWNIKTNQALRQVIIDGDTFGIRRSTGHLQTLEAHRCREATRARKSKSNIGIRRNASTGEKIAFDLTRVDMGTRGSIKISDVNTSRRIGPDGIQQVFQVYNPKRSSMGRGVGAAAPVVDIIGMRDDLDFAKLVQAQVVSSYSIVEKLPDNPDLLGALAALIKSEGDGEEFGFDAKSLALGDDSIDTVKLQPGRILRPRIPGATYETLKADVPNAEYFQFGTLLLTYLSVNLGIPLMVLLLDPSNSNFSAWRGAMQQARMGFASVQDWMVNSWHAPIYRWKVAEWLATDVFLQEWVAGGDDRSIDIYRHGWNPKGYEYIEPVKDTTAHLMQLSNGMTSGRRFAQRVHGCTWEQLVTEIINDRKLAIEAAIDGADELNSSHPDLPESVHWRDLMPTPTAKGISISFGDEPAPQSQGDAS